MWASPAFASSVCTVEDAVIFVCVRSRNADGRCYIFFGVDVLAFCVYDTNDQ